jgi:hypothetical protein
MLSSRLSSDAIREEESKILTVDSIVHDEPSSVSDSFGFLRVGTFMIVSEPDSLSGTTMGIQTLIALSPYMA